MNFITINPIDGNDYVNTANSQAASITISGTTSGVPVNNQVTVFLNGHSYQLVSGTQTNGSWSVTVLRSDVQALTNGDGYSVTASATDSNNHTVSATDTISVDETAPVVTINTPIVGDNSAASTGFAISGTTSDSANGSGAEGSPSLSKFSPNGANIKDTYTTTVSGGTWTVNVTAAQAQALADGTYAVKADLIDVAGNPALEATVPATIETVAQAHQVILVHNGFPSTIYSSIQAAINAASSGDTIVVGTGTYNENVTVNVAGLTILGSGPGTIIEGTFKSSNGISNGGVAAFLEAGNSYTQSAGRGIEVAANNVTIKNLNIDSFTYGIDLSDGTSGTTLSGVNITDSLVGIKKGTTAGVSDLAVTGGSISDGLIGIDFDKTTTAGQTGVRARRRRHHRRHRLQQSRLQGHLCRGAVERRDQKRHDGECRPIRRTLYLGHGRDRRRRHRHQSEERQLQQYRNRQLHPDQRWLIERERRAIDWR